jgi:hypothetical protein
MTNTGPAPVDTHLLVIAQGLSTGIEMTNASGRTEGGDPYLRVFLTDGLLGAGEHVDVTLHFRRNGQPQPLTFTLALLSGQGNP